MAVPKKRISKSKGGMRRGGQKKGKPAKPSVQIDKKTGEYALTHNITPEGYYKGKKVVETKADKKARKKKEKAEKAKATKKPKAEKKKITRDTKKTGKAAAKKIVQKVTKKKQGDR